MVDPENKNRSIYWDGSVRLIVGWQFEGGGFIKIVATDDVPTEKAIEWIERILQVKKNELASMRGGDAEA